MVGRRDGGRARAEADRRAFRMIHLLATGGTIAMRHQPSAGGSVPALDGADLLALVPQRALGAEVRVEDWARRPASHLAQDDLWKLRERVRALLDDETVEGVVVTHGTDVLEETAYLLDRTLSPRAPVVITGAMRTSDAAEWDGGRNLLDAFAVASERAAAGRGVLVVFAGKIFRGREVVKLDAMALDAFGTPHGAPIGEVSDGVVHWFWDAPEPTAPLSPSRLHARVALLPILLGDDGATVDTLRATFDGLVIISYGSGNTPPTAFPALERWLVQRKPVVLASRCPFGLVTPAYGFEGGSARAVALGLVPAGPRTAWQARMELTIALSAGVRYAEGLEA